MAPSGLCTGRDLGYSGNGNRAPRYVNPDRFDYDRRVRYALWLNGSEAEEIGLTNFGEGNYVMPFNELEKDQRLRVARAIASRGEHAVRESGLTEFVDTHGITVNNSIEARVQ